MNKLPNGKWFGAFEVTQAQWMSAMGDNPSKFNEGGDFPVECVSWHECQAFIQKLNALEEVRKSGLTFRLPTAEEWSYACRAGSLANYCRLADGTEISSSRLDTVAWYKDNSNERTHSVGQKQPNAFGLYDILGNVSEWTSSEGITSRVTGGGNWYSPASLCDSGIGKFSDWTNAGYQGSGIGFRLAADDGE